MRTTITVIVNKTGERIEAEMFICEICEGKKFHVFRVGEQEYLQCCQCRETYQDSRQQAS